MKNQQMRTLKHQYVERHTGRVVTERLLADGIVNFLYSEAREDSSRLFRALTGARVSHLLGFINYDTVLCRKIAGSRSVLDSCAVDLSECVDAAEGCGASGTSSKGRYAIGMSTHAGRSASRGLPRDSRMIVGSLAEASSLFLKGKFSTWNELLGPENGKNG